MLYDMLKIDTSKFFVHLLCSSVINFGCRDYGSELTKEFVFAICADTNRPFISTFVPRNSFVSTCIVRWLFLVLYILCGCGLPQIFTTVIESIVVFVVSVFIFLTAEDLAVHFNCAWCAAINRSDSVKTFHSGISLSAPIPLIEPVIVRCVDNRILSSCKRNQAVRWIRWLGNRVPLNSVLWHESSAKGFVLPSHFIIMEGF